jgi:ppGpp synthetase/RelA/SpoT-type nucleotidyltranferase
MIPAALSARYTSLDAKLKKLLDFMTLRLNADLSNLHVVSVSGRPKTSASSLQKLHTGKYAAIDSLTDLVGITVVVLYRREVQDAIAIVKSAGLTVVNEPIRAINPTDFSYREPKLYLKPPPDYLERNPDLEGILCEVQFTTALQHALDMTTHDFDYKGHSYSWGNFRLVAQLRGMLELVDKMIDDIENVSLADHEIIEVPERMIFASSLLSILVKTFAAENLPSDLRRLADTVADWATAVDLSADDLDELLSRHPDLVSAVSLDPTSAILGAIMRERGKDLVANYDRLICVTGELETLVSEMKLVPQDRRVKFDSLGLAAEITDDAL